ncbi:ZIP family metal transporter [Henriciella sp. AS95]|uniref:ZIP family metal transporter n=1 Tax=Henriciella sp. AS95 TaxID=3135782 RepID=UPI00316F58CF
MWSSIQAPLFFGLIACFCTTVGLIVVAQRAIWSERNASLFGLAAAGMLTTLTFLHIIPEAFHFSLNAPVWLAVGFFSGLLLHNGVKTAFPSEDGIAHRHEALTPIIAIAVHSFLDGVIYAVTFAASFSAGVYAAVGLTLHEFPEGVIAFAILRRYGISNVQAFWLAFLAAAATTPLGVIVAGPFMYGLDNDTIGSLFAVSAGLLIFVATGPLMAPLKEMQPVRGLTAIAAGAGAAILLVLAPIQGHGHEDGHDDEHTLPASGHASEGSHDEIRPI